MAGAKNEIQKEYNDPAPAVANENEIRFNGIEDDGHETFYLTREQTGFDFCKTARKPYDRVVVEVLNIVNHLCPNWLSLSSDGDGENPTKNNPEGLIFP